MPYDHKRTLRSLNYLLIAITAVFCAHVLHSLKINTATDNTWQTRITKVLSDIQENSIKNHEWNSRDWECYAQDVLTHVHITNEEDFYKSVSYAFKQKHVACCSTYRAKYGKRW